MKLHSSMLGTFFEYTLTLSMPIFKKKSPWRFLEKVWPKLFIVLTFIHRRRYWVRDVEPNFEKGYSDKCEECTSEILIMGQNGQDFTYVVCGWFLRKRETSIKSDNMKSS